MATRQDSMPTWERVITAIPRVAIRGLDTLLRRAYGVYEFADTEWCLLRIAITPSPRDITLSDGTKIAKGELVGELHPWNEHIPSMPRGGADLAWGLRAYCLLGRSFRLLVRYSATHPEVGRLRAWHGESSFLPKGMGVPGVLDRLGFDVVCDIDPSNHLQRFVDFWESFYWWMLTWAFNPASLRSKDLVKMERWEVWISADRLQDKYGRRDQQNTDG
jgi:hypothetical protein